MSERLINLKLRSKTGQVIEIQAAEIIEIDGKPYVPADGDEMRMVREHCVHLDGRVSALERVLSGGGEQ